MIEHQETISANPSSYDSVNSTYASVNASYPITNGYGNSSSTSYSQINIRTGSGATSEFFYTFSLPAIPDDAEIVSVSCTAKAYISSTSNSYVATRQIQMAAGTTLKGSATNLTTTATAHNLTTGSGWTVEDVRKIAVRLYAVRGTSSTSTARYWRFYGADLTVVYKWRERVYTITASSIAPGVSVSPASQDVAEGGSGSVTISPGGVSIKAYDGGEDVTDQLTVSGANLVYSLAAVDADHDLTAILADLGLISYRTQGDVDRVLYLRRVIKAGTATAEELTEYLGAPIGAYEASDLNRVNIALNTVAFLLTVSGYPYSPAARTNWTNSEEFLAADMAVYLAAVEGLRAKLTVYPDTPATPADVANWQQANAVEKIIEDVYQLYQNMKAGRFRLGEIYMGEVD